MTNLENIRKMSAEALAQYLGALGSLETSPWMVWWNKRYCNECESVKTYVPYLDKEADCAFCELENQCRFFPELSEGPDIDQIIVLWLKAEKEE